jgi:hypothetical protein
MAEATHTIPEAALQLFYTVAISVLGFYIFRAKNRLKNEIKRRHSGTRFLPYLKPLAIAMIGLPTAAYAIMMRDQYVPAVFTMAIVAIIVAADHDAELEEAPAEIAERVEDQLAHVSQGLEDLIKDLKTSVIESNERLAQYKENYSWASMVMDEKITRLSAVIRHWEVPKAFYDHVLTDQPDRMRFAYVDPPQGAALEEWTKRHSKTSVDYTPHYIRFITEAPTRVTHWQPGNADDLHYFLGLLYTMCCIYAVAKYKGKGERAARVRIGSAPIWVHVYPESVYEIAETSDPTSSLARAKDLDFYVDGKANPDRRRRHASTYDRQVRNFYDRGTRAEAYIASILLSLEGPHRRDSGRLETSADSAGFRFPSGDGWLEIAERLGANDELAVLIAKGRIHAAARASIPGPDKSDLYRQLRQVFRLEGKQAIAIVARLVRDYLYLRYDFIHRDPKALGRWSVADVKGPATDDELRRFLLQEVGA